MTSSLREIGEKTFSQQDQQLFAELSHDCNPMHMDPIAARRLITGRQVVHGVHVLLTAIEYWRPDSNELLTSIACAFSNPVSVGEHVVFTQAGDGEFESTLDAVVDGLVCARVTLAHHRETMPALRASNGPRTALDDGELRYLEGLTQPLCDAPEVHPGKRYAIRLDSGDLSAHFPNVSRYLGNHRLKSLLGLSYIVGMVCPGVHSVFSSVELELESPYAMDGVLAFSVRKYDPRFRLFDIRVNGPVQGNLKAFLRPPAQVQPSASACSKQVEATEFKGTRSLIIGGSRGLGEVTAKILAAGGGDTVITYATGLDDAMIIAADIKASTKSVCSVVRLDLSSDQFESSEIEWSALDAIYFFATPRIFRKKSAVFDSGVFQEFYDFYVKKFYELCALIERTIVGKQIRIFLPSSTAVGARPRGMTEYAMAKASAEILAQEVNRSFENVLVVSAQLPRLTTDQTATIMSVRSESNTEVLLPLIRSMHKS